MATKPRHIKEILAELRAAGAFTDKSRRTPEQHAAMAAIESGRERKRKILSSPAANQPMERA